MSTRYLANKGFLVLLIFFGLIHLAWGIMDWSLVSLKPQLLNTSASVFRSQISCAVLSGLGVACWAMAWVEWRKPAAGLQWGGWFFLSLGAIHAALLYFDPSRDQANPLAWLPLVLIIAYSFKLFKRKSISEL